MAVHQIGNPVRCGTLVIAALTLSSLLVCSNFPFAYSGYSFLDKKCNVYFNYTHYYQDLQDVYVNQDRKIRENCWNETVKGVGRKLSMAEIFNCRSKCDQIAIGFANKDGTFNSKFLDKTENYYKKYSNATTSYIRKLLQLLSGCAKEVGDTFKTLQSEKNANVSACLRNRLYSKCRVKVFVEQVQNATAGVEGSTIRIKALKNKIGIK